MHSRIYRCVALRAGGKGVVGDAFTHAGDAIARTEPRGTYLPIVWPTARQEYLSICVLQGDLRLLPS